MSTIETGGPAFPSKKRIYRAGFPTDDFEPVGGMTLRDYFAAKAMQAYFSDPAAGFGRDGIAEAANAAYRIADAMLNARKEKP